jgi:hypothetical protein
LSMTRSPASWIWAASRKTPDWRINASTRVVFPWSDRERQTTRELGMGWVEYEPFYSTTYQHGQQQLHYWKTDRKGEKLSWGITSRFWFGGVLVQDHTESSRQSEFPTRWKMGRPLPTIAIEQTTSGGKREWRLRSSKRSSRKENLYMETSFCRSKFIPRRKNVRHTAEQFLDGCSALRRKWDFVTEDRSTYAWLTSNVVSYLLCRCQYTVSWNWKLPVVPEKNRNFPR